MTASTDVVDPDAAGGFARLRVAHVERLCPDAAAVTFGVPDELAARFRFRPGQYLTLRRYVDGTEERRSYSICAPRGGPARIGVRRVSGGLFSQWLVDELAPGDEVEVARPAGSFTPDLVPGAHHAMIAAGSGITPVLSIAASVLAAHPDTEVSLLSGNRRTDTVMFSEELADLKNRYGPRLLLVHVLSREPTEAEIVSGRLDRAKLRELLGALVPVAEVDQWWLCGPLGMATDAQAVLTELGVPGQRVHRELFYVDVPPPEPVRSEGAEVDSAGSEVTVILDGRSTTLTLPRSVPVLDAARKVRHDLPFACRGGVCGTCRARVTEGELRMRRNFALADDELAAGFVLTCQSLPMSDRAVVDFDA